MKQIFCTHQWKARLFSKENNIFRTVLRGWAIWIYCHHFEFVSLNPRFYQFHTALWNQWVSCRWSLIMEKSLREGFPTFIIELFFKKRKVFCQFAISLAFKLIRFKMNFISLFCHSPLLTKQESLWKTLKGKYIAKTC